MAYNPPIGSIYHLYTTYILPSGGLYNPYHRLGEPETTIENWPREQIMPLKESAICYPVREIQAENPGGWKIHRESHKISHVQWVSRDIHGISLQKFIIVWFIYLHLYNWDVLSILGLTQKKCRKNTQGVTLPKTNSSPRK